MRCRAIRWLGAVTPVLLIACVGTAPATSAPRGTGGAEVLWPDQHSPGQTVLYLIRSRIPNVQIRQASPCPDVEFRGRRSLRHSTPPAIYVQGQRSSNTCILEMIKLADVERIEVFRMGQGYHSAGFAGSAGGTILIFLKDGSS